MAAADSRTAAAFGTAGGAAAAAAGAAAGAGAGGGVVRLRGEGALEKTLLFSTAKAFHRAYRSLSSELSDGRSKSERGALKSRTARDFMSKKGTRTSRKCS